MREALMLLAELLHQCIISVFKQPICPPNGPQFEHKIFLGDIIWMVGFEGDVSVMTKMVLVPGSYRLSLSQNLEMLH
jgi:hypothetical protein